MKKTRVIVYGIGLMGSLMVKILLDKEWIEIVGGICRSYPDAKDAAKIKGGKDLGEVANIGRKLGILVSDNPSQVFADTKADIVLHATRFPSDDLESQIIGAVKAGINVITITDSRLVYPWMHWPELGRRVDQAAKKSGVTVLSTGLSPGFMTDLVPILFTGIYRKVNKISVQVAGDLTPFGTSALKKYGVGLAVHEFQQAMPDKIAAPARSANDVNDMLFMFAEVGMIADALGWQLDEMTLAMKPLASTKLTRSLDGMEVEPGRVCGVEEVTCGIRDGEPVITLKRTITLDLEAVGLEAGGSILIEGDEVTNILIKGIKNIDAPTCAYAINTIPQVIKAEPGLVTMRDLPVASAVQ